MQLVLWIGWGGREGGGVGEGWGGGGGGERLDHIGKHDFCFCSKQNLAVVSVTQNERMPTKSKKFSKEWKKSGWGKMLKSLHEVIMFK